MSFVTILKGFAMKEYSCRHPINVSSLSHVKSLNVAIS